MSSNLQTKTPLNATFGLHYGFLGKLPSPALLANIKSFARAFEYQLLAIDLNTLLETARSQSNAVLELHIPTLGFTDPVFDYEATPWFAIPLVINGFVAKSEDSSLLADVYVNDIMDNQYALRFDKQGRVDYPAIAAEQSSAIYTTLKSIQYCYALNQLSEERGLQLLAKDEYKQKVLLLLPKKHAAFQIECSLRVKQKEIMVKQYAVAASIVNSNTMQVDTQWQGDVEQGRLQVDYHCQNNSNKENAFEADLSVLLPQAENLQYLIYGSQTWLNTHQNKRPCLTQYYGLSAGVLLTILQTLVPFELFCQNLSEGALCQNLGFDNINAYTKKDNSLATLYHYLLSAVINRSMPLYALKPYMSTEADIFDVARMLDITKWSVHDQMVYQQIFSSIEQAIPSVEILWDTLDSYFSFGAGGFTGKLLLETKGAKLPKTPEVSITLSLKKDTFIYPLADGYKESVVHDTLTDSSLKKPARGDSNQKDME